MAAMPPGGYLGALAGAANGTPMPKPPQMPGGPPPPTGVGAVPTGDADTKSTPRTSASAAIMALRDLKGHFPSMAAAIDGWTAQITAAAQSPAGGGQKPEGAAGKPPAVPGSADLSALLDDDSSGGDDD